MVQAAPDFIFPQRLPASAGSNFLLKIFCPFFAFHNLSGIKTEKPKINQTRKYPQFCHTKTR